MALRYVARQPIFDRTLRVVGYELLYRTRPTGPASVTDDDVATFSVLYEALVDLGLESTVQQARAWVNVSPALLAGGGHRMIGADRVVLELLEGADRTPELADLVRTVRGEGYVVALDDFVVGDGRDLLVDLVDVVKLELPAVPPGRLSAHVAAVRRPGVTVLVEKVETVEQLTEAMAAGADLFQGFFFTRPQVLSTRSIPAGTHAVLAVLARLHDPTAEPADLTALVGTDVTLAQKVLQSVNSGFAALQHRVGSLHQAVVLLGSERLRQLVTLLVLAGATGKPPELSRQALIRAEMTSALLDIRSGGSSSRADRESAFTVGLMSTLDAFTDLPLAEVAARLSLDDRLYDALVHHVGPLGDALSATLDYEAAADDDRDDAVVEAYLTAVRHADERWDAIAGY
ncbi:MAG TPA: HDOD domain-containing protein [Cellulomonadaceae bacterium]|nr:HDOD domain-containing protein [Cellulomonadaceae bacterium]